MKVELIKYYIRQEAQKNYSLLKAPYTQDNYALYLGEDESHIWIHPLIGKNLNDDNPIIFLSFMRLMVGDVIICNDEDMLEKGITNIPFSDMKYVGLTTFD